MTHSLNTPYITITRAITPMTHDTTFTIVRLTVATVTVIVLGVQLQGCVEPPNTPTTDDIVLPCNKSTCKPITK